MADTNRDFNPKKENEYRTWVIWNSMPRHLTAENMEQLSIGDPLLAKLATIRTQKDLAAFLKVRPTTISEWAKQPIRDEFKQLDWRYWAKQATPLIVAKYIDKLLIHADAPRFTAWMKYVEQAEEKSQVDVDVKHEGLAALIAGADKVLKDHGESI